jgi:hypothetical protein
VKSVPYSEFVNQGSDIYKGDLLEFTVPKFTCREEKSKCFSHDWQLSDRESNRIRYE